MKLSRRPPLRIRILALALALIAATTMVPTGFRHPSLRFIDNVFHPWDVVDNVLLYIPLGIALGGTSLLRAFLSGLAVSGLAETLQLWYIERTPSFADVLNNTLGAVVGFLIAAAFFSRRSRQPLSLPLPRWLAVAALPLTILGALTLLHNRPPHDFSNWNAQYQLSTGDEVDGGRQWEGTLSGLVIYPFAMPPVEIQELARIGKVSVAATGQTPVYGPVGAAELKAQFRKPLLSPQEQARFYDTLTTSNQFTLLVMMTTPDLDQSGPARIVTYSVNSWSRNFTLGQNLNGLVLRLRTPSSGGNGTDPALYTGPVLEANRPTMVAAVYDGRFSRLYVDGKQVAQADLSVRRPRLPKRLVTMLPNTIPLREVELVTAEFLLSSLFAVGVFGYFGVPGRVWKRCLFGCAAGALIATLICAFSVSRPALGTQIFLECLTAGLLVAGSVEPDPKES